MPRTPIPPQSADKDPNQSPEHTKPQDTASQKSQDAQAGSKASEANASSTKEGAEQEASKDEHAAAIAALERQIEELTESNDDLWRKLEAAQAAADTEAGARRTLRVTSSFVGLTESEAEDIRGFMAQQGVYPMRLRRPTSVASVDPKNPLPIGTLVGVFVPLVNHPMFADPVRMGNALTHQAVDCPRSISEVHPAVESEDPR